MRKTMSVLLVGLMLSAVASTASAVTFMGKVSCGLWATERSDNKQGAKIWLMGFLSGMASASGKDVLEGADADSLTLWMDGYCKANPLDSVGNSAVLLFQELAKRKGIKL